MKQTESAFPRVKSSDETNRKHRMTSHNDRLLRIEFERRIPHVHDGGKSGASVDGHGSVEIDAGGIPHIILSSITLSVTTKNI